MIYLHAENPSALGDDTFWTWIKRTFPDKTTWGLPARTEAGDTILQYSTLGPCTVPGEGEVVALCWELYPEMRDRLGSREWDAIIDRTHACAAAAHRRVVASPLMAPFYAEHGAVDVLPIGVDTDLFAPQSPLARCAARHALGCPEGVPLVFWCGTSHPMKGYDRVITYAEQHPDVRWIVVWKTPGESELRLPAQTITVQATVPQATLAHLMATADAVLHTSRLRPFAMVEWEAMACDVPVIDVTGLSERDVIIDQPSRWGVFQLGWDRRAAARTWATYLNIEGGGRHEPERPDT